MKISWKIFPHLTSCRVGCTIDVSIYTLHRSRSGFAMFALAYNRLLPARVRGSEVGSRSADKHQRSASSS